MDQRGRFQPRFQPFLFKLLLFFVCFVCVKCEEVSACSFQFSSQQIPISSGVLDNELEGKYAWDLCEALSALPLDHNWKGIQMNANNPQQETFIGIGDLWGGNQNKNKKKVDLGCDGAVCHTGTSTNWGVSALTPVLTESAIVIEVVGGSSSQCEIGERTTQFHLKCSISPPLPLISHPQSCSMEIHLFSPEYCLSSVALNKEEEGPEASPFYGVNCEDSFEGENGVTYQWSLCSKIRQRGECNGANFCQISRKGEQLSLGVRTSEPEQLENAIMLSLTGGSQGQGCGDQFRLSTILIFCKTREKEVPPPPVVTEENCVYTLEIFSEWVCVEDEEELKRSKEEEKLSNVEMKALLKEARKAFGRKKVSSSARSSGVLLPMAQSRTGPEEMWKRMQLRRMQAKEKEREEEERREEERKQRKMAGGEGEMGWVLGLMEEVVEEQLLLAVSHDNPSSFTLDLFQRLEEEKQGGRAGKFEVVPPSFSPPVLSLPSLGKAKKGGGEGCSGSVLDEFLTGLQNIGKKDENEGLIGIGLELGEKTGVTPMNFLNQDRGGSHLVRDRFQNRFGRKGMNKGEELSQAEISNQVRDNGQVGQEVEVKEEESGRGGREGGDERLEKDEQKEEEERVMEKIQNTQNEQNEQNKRNVEKEKRGRRRVRGGGGGGGGESGRRRFDVRSRVSPKERRTERAPLRNSALMKQNRK